jgi:tight adherence protein C
MTPGEVASLGLLGFGVSLLLADVPWFRDRSLVQRLRPYLPSSGRTADGRAGPAVDGSLGPLAERIGGLISRLLGVSADLPTRIARAGWDIDAETFRLRQLTHGVVALIIGGAIALSLGPPAPLALAVLVAAPCVSTLAHEHAVSRAAEERRRRLDAELAVIAEQLGLLLSAGYSVTGAITRLALRSGGIAAADLQLVVLRIRHGVGEDAALAEWADLADLDAVRRLTSALALHGETADLGVLVSDVARGIRAASHRELLETIERRAQLVWIPVTVSTLVPGLIFLAVPFMAAMSQVTGGS